jgi:hypothetical protein
MGDLNFSVPDTELSATLHNRRAEVVDNIFKGTPTLAAMSRLGGVRTVDGGYEQTVPIRMAKNSAAGSFSDYDILDTTPQNVLTSLKYEWAGEYATISISWMEEKRNQGKGRLLNLLNQKIDDAGATIRDNINTKLLQAQPAAGSVDVNSITEIIDEAPSGAPSRSTSIGSIANSNTWWRNKATSGGAFTVADMNTMFNDISDGSEFPTFMLSYQTPFEYYENSQVGQIRYSDTRIADAGFQNLMFKNVPFLWDPAVANTDEIYFINTKYFYLATVAGGDFVTTDFIEPDNQAAKVAKILWMGQLMADNRRRLGTLHGITAPA